MRGVCCFSFHSQVGPEEVERDQLLWRYGCNVPWAGVSLAAKVCSVVSVSQVFYYYTRYQHDPVYLRLLVSNPRASVILHLAYMDLGTRSVGYRHHPSGESDQISHACGRPLTGVIMQALISHTGQ